MAVLNFLNLKSILPVALTLLLIKLSTQMSIMEATTLSGMEYLGHHNGKLFFTNSSQPGFVHIAKQYCADHGMILAEFDTMGEFEFVRSKLSTTGKRIYWTGGKHNQPALHLGMEWESTGKPIEVSLRYTGLHYFLSNTDGFWTYDNLFGSLYFQDLPIFDRSIIDNVICQAKIG